MNFENIKKKLLGVLGFGEGGTMLPTSHEHSDPNAGEAKQEDVYSEDRWDAQMPRISEERSPFHKRLWNVLTVPLGPNDH